MDLHLDNLYISPLEGCNLHCRSCYTTKTNSILSNSQILDFVSRYQNYLKKISLVKGISGEAERDLKSIIFCGGEVLLLPDFPSLVNNLISQHIFITIITNGTIDRLGEINDPQNYQLLVSFDGPKSIHDHNRGQGNFSKSYKFIEHALSLGFAVEIFYLITKESYPYRDSFDIMGLKKTYLVDRLGSLTPAQTKTIRHRYPCYPPKHFGCSVLSLQSDGKLYSCCESNQPLASLSDPIDKIVNNYITAVSQHPLCSDPDYFCNLQP